MKRNIVWTVFFVCMLLVNIAAMAGDEFACSPKNVAGTWGYIETATIFDAGVGYPYASVGSYTLDAQGNLSGARLLYWREPTLRATIVGTATVNPDCTGTENLIFYDESGEMRPAGRPRPWRMSIRGERLTKSSQSPQG